MSLYDDLSELHKAGQPTPGHIAVMEDGSPHYNDQALVAKYRGAALAWKSLPTVLALIEAAQQLSESYSDRDSASWSRFRAALAPFVSTEGNG